MERLIGFGDSEVGLQQLQHFSSLIKYVPHGLGIQSIERFKESNDPRKFVLFLLGLGLQVQDDQTSRLEKVLQRFERVRMRQVSSHEPVKISNSEEMGHCWVRAFGDPIEIAIPIPAASTTPAPLSFSLPGVRPP
jgi:acyl-CoA thioesterase